MKFGVGLTADMQAALNAGRPVYLLAFVDHPDGEVFLWSGIGEVVWDGDTYIGRGVLGTLSQVEAGTDLQIAEREMYLTGVDPDAAQLIDSNVRNRSAFFWLACVDDQRHIIADPYFLEEVLMDAQSMPVGDDGSVSVKITGYSGLWELERAQSLAWSPEEARLEYPDETGFDQIPILVNKETKWTLT